MYYKLFKIKADAISTVGPSNGTHLELWTFVELHSQHYAAMLEQWNKDHPDKQIQITFTTYPYGDMHNKLMMSLQAGSGAPDMCDVEIGQFPNFIPEDEEVPEEEAEQAIRGILLKSQGDKLKISLIALCATSISLGINIKDNCIIIKKDITDAAEIFNPYELNCP